jgi:hypothetical protein
MNDDEKPVDLVIALLNYTVRIDKELVKREIRPEYS